MEKQDYLTARGWLFEDERVFLFKKAREIANTFEEPRMVNIGVEYGASLHCLRAGAPEATIYGVDLDTSKLEGDPRAVLLEGDSSDGDVSRRVRKPVHLLFIDGDHSYAGVMGDLERWADKVVPGGILILHDHVISREHPHWQEWIKDVPLAAQVWLEEQPEGLWQIEYGPVTLGVWRRTDVEP